jgi:hemerythrin superfamily protein
MHGAPPSKGGTAVDAITILRDDHDKVRKLFTEYERSGDSAPKERRRIADQIIEELTVHTYIEEELFYPTVAELGFETKGDTADDLVKEAVVEHAQVKVLLSELETLSPEDEYFDAKVTVVIDDVRHHAEEEENEMFPKVREAMGRNDLQDLGRRMLEAKEKAPLRPSEA